MRAKFSFVCKVCDKKFDYIHKYEEHIPRCDRQQRIRKLAKKIMEKHDEAFRRLAKH